jgi:hypothetical protein
VREDRALGAPAERGGIGGPGTSGAGRVLVAVYGTFALAAGARAAVQLGTRFAEAPVAYLLSALAAVVYVVATVGLVRGGVGGRRTALIAITVELVGVLVVGTTSLADPAAFPDETVWSAYGRGYYYVPLVLPVLGLLLLRRSGRREQAQRPAAQESPPPKSPDREPPAREPPAQEPPAREPPAREPPGRRPAAQKSPPPKSPPPKSPPPKSPPASP